MKNAADKCFLKDFKFRKSSSEISGKRRVKYQRVYNMNQGGLAGEDKIHDSVPLSDDLNTY